VRVLVGCECSGRVRDAFLARGHNAWSCDLKPAPGSRHLQCDVLDVLGWGWDLGIFFPDCTYLTCSAEWAYGDGPYHQKVKPETLTGEARRAARREAVAFVMRLAESGIKRLAIENPRGHLSRAWRRPDQVIQPYEFGDDASKATCLWLNGLFPLRPTNPIAPRWVDGRPRWGNQTENGQNRLSPAPERAAVRAITYPGIATAMAEQWG